MAKEEEDGFLKGAFKVVADSVQQLKEKAKSLPSHPADLWWGEGDGPPKQMVAPVKEQTIIQKALRMTPEQRKQLKYNDPSLDAYATKVEADMGLPAGLLVGIKNYGERSESTAVSPKGAKGVMQFMDDTRKAYSHDPSDPFQSIEAGGKYFRDLIKQYDGDVRAAIAHYNGGTSEGKAVKAGKEPTKSETREYLKRLDDFLSQKGQRYIDGKPVKLEDFVSKRNPLPTGRSDPSVSFIAEARDTLVEKLQVPKEIASDIAYRVKNLTPEDARRATGLDKMLADDGSTAADFVSPMAMVGMVVPAVRAGKALATLDKAAASGKSAEEIWKTHKAWKVDGQWRTWIGDDNLNLKAEGLKKIRAKEDTTLGEMVKHDELFAAMPELKDIKVKVNPMHPQLQGGAEAIYDTKTNQVILSKFSGSLPEVKTILHETQHAVQQFGGMNQGTNVNAITKTIGGYTKEEMAVIKTEFDAIKKQVADIGGKDLPLGLIRIKLSKGEDLTEVLKAYPKLKGQENLVEAWYQAGELLREADNISSQAYQKYLRNEGEAVARQTENAYQGDFYPFKFDVSGDLWKVNKKAKTKDEIFETVRYGE